ncbi:nucleotidyltransferase domain-containing protein [Candidatus Pacearchaeota archaeon]|nr:nucleotidyltransferase domain-containing protein [Candidatus Pacearchaeota archaeon]
MIKNNLTNLQENILRYLFINTGKSFNARRLAKNLGVSSPAISKALSGLKQRKLVLIEKNKESGHLKIELNIENSLVLGLKRADNLKLIYESGLNNYLEEIFPGSTIILFGSFSTGNDYYNSDIDIAIFDLKQKEINLKKFEKILEKEIRINFYNSFKELNKNLKNNILNGVILSGGVEL